MKMLLIFFKLTIIKVSILKTLLSVHSLIQLYLVINEPRKLLKMESKCLL